MRHLGGIIDDAGGGVNIVNDKRGAAAAHDQSALASRSRKTIGCALARLGGMAAGVLMCCSGN